MINARAKYGTRFALVPLEPVVLLLTVIPVVAVDVVLFGAAYVSPVRPVCGVPIKLAMYECE
jgi:hypothetical protein